MSFESTPREQSKQEWENQGPLPEEFSKEQKMVTWTFSWGLSFALHLVLILALMSIYLVRSIKKKPPLLISRPPRVEQPYDMTLPRALHRTPKTPEVKIKQKVEKPIKNLSEKIETKTPKGTSLDNLSTKNLESTSTVDSLGVGGGRAGAYGSRFGKGKWSRYGGSIHSENAVQASLRWLKRHQTEEGFWKSYDYDTECKLPIRCKNKRHGPREDQTKNPDYYVYGRGFAGFDVGVTALAILAFLGNGHTHKFGRYRHVVRKGIEWLKKIQVNDPSSKWHGSIGYVLNGKKVDHPEWIYNHAIATMALSEAYAITKDYALRDYAQRAVDFAIKCQNPGLGWSHHTPSDDPEKVIRPGLNDSAVTGWMVLALKSAKKGGLRVPSSCFQGALKWFDLVTNSQGAMGYMAPDGRSSVLPGRENYYEERPTMTAVGMLCRMFSGMSRHHLLIRKGKAILMRNLPKWPKNSHRSVNMYYWYYGTYAMFQVGGKDWHCGKHYNLKDFQAKDMRCCWNHAMQKALILNQRQGVQGDCADGSWDPIGEWGIAGGRVYATAMGAITLEVFYRYLRLRN